MRGRGVLFPKLPLQCNICILISNVFAVCSGLCMREITMKTWSSDVFNCILFYEVYSKLMNMQVYT